MCIIIIILSLSPRTPLEDVYTIYNPNANSTFDAETPSSTDRLRHRRRHERTVRFFADILRYYIFLQPKSVVGLTPATCSVSSQRSLIIATNDEKDNDDIIVLRRDSTSVDM